MNNAHLSNFLSIDERKRLVHKNDWKAVGGILKHAIIIVATFYLVAWSTNIATVVIALFLLGGQQLACAVLTHDAGHFALLKNRKWNTIVGNWLGGYLVFQDVKKYGPYHLKHHLNTGTDDDPDLLLTRGYPTSKKSMMRKFFRDLTGQTGVKALAGLILMQLGYLEYNMGGKVVKVDQSHRSLLQSLRIIFNELAGIMLAQLLVWLALYLTIGGWYYVLWIGAYLTTFQFCIRVRSMAEHSMTDNSDPIRNTRTTDANWLEHLLFAPFNVNYHVEHHMLMTVPFYASTIGGSRIL